MTYDHDQQRDTVEEEYQRTFVEREAREELAAQLRREHQAGIADALLEQESRRFMWDIEGWDGDELLLYIVGSGLHRIPVDEVARLANAMLSEHEILYRPMICDTCGTVGNRDDAIEFGGECPWEECGGTIEWYDEWLEGPE